MGSKRTDAAKLRQQSGKEQTATCRRQQIEDKEIEMWRKSHDWKTGVYASATLLALMILLKLGGL